MTLSLGDNKIESRGVKLQSSKSPTLVRGTSLIKRGFARMQKHGVIMDVTNVEQAQIAEDSGVVAVMVLDKLPYDIRKAGGVARTASIKIIQDIMDAVTIPIMAKCRIGHVSEAKNIRSDRCRHDRRERSFESCRRRAAHLEMGVYYTFCQRRKESRRSLRRIEEGCAMIRTKGEPGTGDVAEAVSHIKFLNNEIRKVRSICDDNQELIRVARELKVSFATVEETARLNRLPVVNLCCRWNLYPCRCGFSDEPWMRWSICWLRYFQSRRRSSACKCSSSCYYIFR